MVFGKHTPFLVLVWQMRPQVRCILFTLVYDIRANRLLTTSRLFTPVCCLHHDGQYDWFTPWWSIWLVYTMMVNMIGWRALYKVGYLQHQELLCMCRSMSELWTLKHEYTSGPAVKLNKEATHSVLSPLSPRKLKRVTLVKRLLFKNLRINLEV